MKVVPQLLLRRFPQIQNLQISDKITEVIGRFLHYQIKNFVHRARVADSVAHKEL